VYSPLTVKALITGISGQDGSYLAEFLLAKGYEVHGLVRRSSSFNTQRIEHLYKDRHEKGVKLFLHYADLSDSSRIITLLSQIEPTEIYNLASQSNVAVSFLEPELTGEITGIAAARILEAIRVTKLDCKYYQASSSEMFGDALAPQSELTEFRPRSPYATSKLYAHFLTINYRKAYDIHASCGILFNHESPRRGETFVTRKITMAAAKIALGMQKQLYLGNLKSKRDWGYAPEYVEAMWLMLQQNQPDDYVVATGTSYSVEDFCQMAFDEVNLDWKKYTVFDSSYLRPLEVENLQGDPSKSLSRLGWKAQTFVPQLVKIMVAADIKKFSKLS
jgi:GDPmannose 4,6-dehydratase